ncbi:MAG TPA: substrate-binding domain-containing protein [Sphingomonas sp.]|uniref:substrate-binding domain-containing protein n=1 Tax=Sphingomonas sp. TaxID=28214 RepID=UPI002B676E99|nr:substrate-binding domain-containing protein [Sphingomonas sp.]HMI19511.1 substrate-binding domain-containing protein [Sphingomonas sp.]
MRLLGKSVRLALPALIALALAGCGRSHDNRLRVTASFSSLSTPYFITMRQAAEKYAPAAGVSITALDGQANSAKQGSDLETVAADGTQGVILAANDGKALAPEVDRLRAAGVQVVAVDRRIYGTAAPVPYVGADNVAGGRLLASWVVEHFPQGAHVIVITNEPGTSTQLDRSRGVREGLAAGGAKYQIVAEQTANSSRDQALTVVQNLLTSFGPAHRPDAILCLNDNMALGAISALKEAGLAPGAVKVLGFDAIPEALDNIKAGKLAATVDQDAAAQIRAALATIVQAIKGGKAQSVSIAPHLVTAETLK